MTSTSLKAGAGLVRPMRVALFSGNYNYTRDGANQALNRLVHHLEAEAGAEVRVYSPTSPTPAFAHVGELISVPSFRVPLRPDYRVALGLPIRVRRAVEAFRPDLIHLSAPDLLGLGALRLAKALDIPVVASVHTHFESYLDYYALGWLKPFLEGRLRAFYGACDFVLAPTAAIADQMQADAPSAKVRVWARGVDPQVFNPARRCQTWRQQHGFTDDRPVVAFLGRVVMEKGLALFVETIRRLEARSPNISVVIIGDGPARAWLQEMLPDAVFTGFLTGEALATAVASADIFFNPSSTETFGNVNLEAMASGLALVCADAPNMRTLVRHGVDGLLCRPQDPESYCEAILSLVADLAARVEMGRQANLQSAAYRWPQILDGMVEVYREAFSVARAGKARRGVRAQEDSGVIRLRDPAFGGLSQAVAGD